MQNLAIHAAKEKVCNICVHPFYQIINHVMYKKVAFNLPGDRLGVVHQDQDKSVNILIGHVY